MPQRGPSAAHGPASSALEHSPSTVGVSGVAGAPGEATGDKGRRPGAEPWGQPPGLQAWRTRAQGRGIHHRPPAAFLHRDETPWCGEGWGLTFHEPRHSTHVGGCSDTQEPHRRWKDK